MNDRRGVFYAPGPKARISGNIDGTSDALGFAGPIELLAMASTFADALYVCDAFHLGDSSLRGIAMGKSAFIARVFFTVLSVVIVAPAAAADPSEAARRKAEMDRIRAEHQRRIAEMKRGMNTPSHRGLPPVQTKPAAPTPDFRGNAVGGGAFKQPPRDFRGKPVAAGGRTSEAPPFNASSAPPPDEALKAFAALVRSASTMEQLLPHLPASEQTALQAHQSTYDPKEAAASRARWRKKMPEMKEESITFLTNSPYTNELNRLKSTAGGILDVLSVKVEGNKATLVVSTSSGATINGELYEYGKADIEMIGEGNGWKFAGYSDSRWVYKEPPTKP